MRWRVRAAIALTVLATSCGNPSSQTGTVGVGLPTGEQAPSSRPATEAPDATAVGPTQSAASTGPAGSQTTSGAGGGMTTQESLDRLPDLIRERVATGSPEVRGAFAGLEVDSASDRVTVWRVPNISFDTLLRSLGDSRISVQRAAYGLAQLEGWRNDVLKHQAELSARRVAVSETQIAKDGSGIVVLVTSDPASARDALSTLLPGVPITVQPSDGVSW